jgi:hypothetical protein
MPLSDIVTVAITTTGPAPTQQGFGIPLILGAVQNATYGADRIRFYTSLTGMTTDGFLTTDPEYLAAQAIFSQNPAPPQIAVGKRTNKPTQQFKIKILQGVVGKVYTAFINGVAKSFTAVDTVVANIATGLAAAIGTPTGFGAAAAVTDTVTFTASVAGNWCRVSVTNPNVDMDNWQSHADNAVQTELTAIRNIDDTWYGIISTFAGTIGATNTSEVGQIAAWAEANQKLYIADVQDSTIIGSGSSDVSSNLKALNYARTTAGITPTTVSSSAPAWPGSACRSPPARRRGSSRRSPASR